MRKLFLQIFALIISATSASAQSSSVVACLDSLFNARYADTFTTAAPGASILIAKDGIPFYERQYGIADMETRRKITPETSFNIASVSKQFTVIGALRLVDRNLLDIDAPLCKYFPNYKSQLWRRVTTRHLMSQSSGIPDTRPRVNRHDMIFATDSTSALYFGTLDSLKFTPGTDYDYVNPTFILIAKEIEKLTGTDFITYQQRAIFDPIGMTSTCYFDPKQMPSHIAHSYDYNSDRQHWEIFEYGQETFFATRPDGGIYSTPRDLLKWENALHDDLIISQETKRKAYMPQTKVGGSRWCSYQNRENTYYGLGFFIDKTPGFSKKVYHTGDNGCFQAYLAKYPDENVVIIVLENRNDHDRWSMAKEIDNILKRHKLL